MRLINKKSGGNLKNGLVYSTDRSRLCPVCERGDCDSSLCRKRRNTPLGDGIVRVGRETKGRKGSGVSLIRGLPLAADELKKLAQIFKKKCGTGGTVKNGVIEIQGDHRQLLVSELEKQGYKAKLAGG